MRPSRRLLLVAVAAAALAPWVGSATSARHVDASDGAATSGKHVRPTDGGAAVVDVPPVRRPPSRLSPSRPLLDAPAARPSGPAVAAAGQAPRPSAPVRHSREGWLVAGAGGAQVGDGTLRTYTVEVEPATGWSPQVVAATVDAALLDPDRGWTAAGRWALRRVDDPDADLRVVLASPGTVDAACADAGLDTNGIFSCWDGTRAMLNVVRWEHGAADFDDLDAYRRYQVNHEVGHALGLGHADCPGAGRPAPVMMQQTKSTAGCVANGWPSP